MQPAGYGYNIFIITGAGRHLYAAGTGMTKEAFMNPIKLLQLKNAWDCFKGNHPKFPKFLSALYQKGMKEGTVIEFRVTTPDGEELAANLKLKGDDIALFRELQDLLKS